MSPIEGLTTVRRLPRLGKVKMGVKVLSAKGIEHPQKTDHFVVPPEIEKVYGKEPKSLDILIPVEDEEKWAPQYYKLYSATQGLVCRGDGVIASRLIDTATGDRAHRFTEQAVRREWTCQGRKCPDYLAKDGCKEVMSLQFMLYKVPGMGVWQIDTSSVNSIININSCADFIRAMYNGHLAMIPLQLTIEPKQVQNPETGKRQTVYVLNLRDNHTFLEMVESTKRFQELLPGKAHLALPAADDAVVEPGELAEDGEEPAGTEPEPAPEPDEPSEPPETETQTESDRLFDEMESASKKAPAIPAAKVEAQWVVSTINELRKKGCEAVTGNKLAERFAKNYAIRETLEGMSMKQVLAMLTPEQAADFCKWLQDLEGEA